MPKIDLTFYIEVLDRMLERKGFSDDEREDILLNQKNVDLIEDSFKKFISPKYIFTKLDTSFIDEKEVFEIYSKSNRYN